MVALPLASLAGTGLLILAGAGCIEPSVAAYGPNALSIRYDPRANTAAEVLDKAEKLCGRHGKLAALVAEAPDARAAGQLRADFDCIDP